MSKLRLLSLICAIVVSISFLYWFSYSSHTAFKVGFIAAGVGIIVKIVRYLYRD